MGVFQLQPKQGVQEKHNIQFSLKINENRNITWPEIVVKNDTRSKMIQPSLTVKLQVESGTD